MNWKRTLLYTLFAAYQIMAFVFTYMVDGHMDLLALLKYVPLFKWVSLIGVILIIVDIVWYRREKEAHELENDAWRRENNALKSRLEKESAPKVPAEKL